jgi:hypothetical protein
VCLDVDVRIDALEFSLGRDGFRQLGRNVVLVVQHLSVKIGDFEKIAIDQSQVSNSGAREQLGKHGAQSATTAHEYSAGLQLVLPRLAEGAESGLSNVTWIDSRHDGLVVSIAVQVIHPR